MPDCRGGLRSGPDSGERGPSTSDKLAQRNLAFVNVPNPGVDPSRVAPQTFEVRRSPVTLLDDNRPDELMIRWGSTPDGSTATFFLPGANAAEVMDWAGKLYTTHSISMLDAHTVQTPAGGVTFLPIPQGSGPNFAGLMSVNLPTGIRKGQQFDVLVDRSPARITRMSSSTSPSVRLAPRHSRGGGRWELFR